MWETLLWHRGSHTNLPIAQLCRAICRYGLPTSWVLRAFWIASFFVASMLLAATIASHELMHSGECGCVDTAVFAFFSFNVFMIPTYKCVRGQAILQCSVCTMCCLLPWLGLAH